MVANWKYLIYMVGRVTKDKSCFVSFGLRKLTLPMLYGHYGLKQSCSVFAVIE